MKKIVITLCTAVFALCAGLTTPLRAQTEKPDAPAAVVQNSDNRFCRPLGEVLEEIAKRFRVKLRYNIDTAGLVLPYADARIRPYSVKESLTNVLSYFDYKWEDRGKKTYKLSPYEYYRRKDGDGEKLIAWLSGLYSDSVTFQARRELLKREFRARVGIDRLLAHCVARNSAASHRLRMMDGRVNGSRNLALSPVKEGRLRKKDGYTVRNFALETLPGLYVCGSVYAPAGKGVHPLILCPNGHFADGRYNPDLQTRMATLARMGAVVVGWDLFGWGESEWQVGKASHTLAVAQPMQLMNGLLIMDWILQRRDIDHTRVAVNGGSGGGTHCVMLTLLDERITAACPVASFCSHFDGGCPCESGMGTALCGGGTCNAEYAALFAPKPLGVVSDGGDWTHTVPVLEYPYLQRIYGFYNAAERVTNYHYPGDRHDFGINKRNAVYDFFAKVFGLDSACIDESRVEIETAAALQSFGSPERLPEGAVRSMDELRTLWE